MFSKNMFLYGKIKSLQKTFSFLASIKVCFPLFEEPCSKLHQCKEFDQGFFGFIYKSPIL